MKEKGWIKKRGGKGVNKRWKRGGCRGEENGKEMGIKMKNKMEMLEIYGIYEKSGKRSGYFLKRQNIRRRIH